MWPHTRSKHLLQLAPTSRHSVRKYAGTGPNPMFATQGALCAAVQGRSRATGGFVQGAHSACLHSHTLNDSVVNGTTLGLVFTKHCEQKYLPFTRRRTSVKFVPILLNYCPYRISQCVQRSVTNYGFCSLHSPPAHEYSFAWIATSYHFMSQNTIASLDFRVTANDMEHVNLGLRSSNQVVTSA